MTQVLVQWDGREWPLDTQEITMAQAFVIKDITKDDQFSAGRNLAAWEMGLKGCEPNCVRALFWLMLQQDGQRTTIGSVPGDFPLLRFHTAWAEATAAAERDPDVLEKAITEGEATLARMRVAYEKACMERALAEPERPTPRTATESAQSSERSSTTSRKSSGDKPE